MSRSWPINTSVVKAIAILLLGHMTNMIIEINTVDFVVLMGIVGLFLLNDTFLNYVEESLEQAESVSQAYVKQERMYFFLHNTVKIVLPLLFGIYWLSSVLHKDKFAAGIETEARAHVTNLYNSVIQNPNRIVSDSLAKDTGGLMLSVPRAKEQYLAPAKPTFQHVADMVQKGFRNILGFFLGACFVILIVLGGAQKGSSLSLRIERETRQSLMQVEIDELEDVARAHPP